ncbi:MAG: hypothetical protein LBE09_05140 [Christensenellaceae bacterium]|jgi:hypothetical protein|nr:hypothetical protein [Christensenellaceae bacterium]
MELNKKEKHLMDVIYESALSKTGQCLISPLEILAKIPYKVKFSENDLQPVMDALSYDGYLEYELATKKGDPMYFISLKEKGFSYERQKKQNRIKIIRRVITTVIFALLSWAVKMIVDAIISR